MLKPVLLLAVATMLAGCPSPTAGTPAAGLPGTVAPTGTTKITTLTNAEMDALIDCAKSKGSVGAALVNGWGAIKGMYPEGSRDPIKPAVEIQAKAIGCL
jgi:hypothetical protein